MPRTRQEQIRQDRRRLTPRIESATQDGTTSLSVVFDRDMDETRDVGVFRTFDDTDGVVQWTDGAWTDSRTWESSTSEVITTFSGTRNIRYMSGTLGTMRYPVFNYERCDRVEDA